MLTHYGNFCNADIDQIYEQAVVEFEVRMRWGKEISGC